MEKAEFRFSHLLVSFPAIALEMMIPAMLLWFLISRVVLLWRTLRLARRHGFLMLRLKRPNVSGEIQEILDARPAFDKQAFRALWPSEQHAQCAERLLEIASEYWRLPGKMLYPNDPLLFFYFGKCFPWWWNRMLLEPPPGTSGTICSRSSKSRRRLQTWTMTQRLPKWWNVCLGSVDI